MVFLRFCHEKIKHEGLLEDHRIRGLSLKRRIGARRALGVVV